MACAKAITQATCVVVPVEVFEKELGNMSAFMKAMMLNLIDRLRDVADSTGEGEIEFEEEDDGVTFFSPGEDGKYEAN